MIWGMIGALEQEIELIKNEMKLKKTVKRFGCDYFVGTIGSQQVVAACCSVGKVNAAVCASTMILEFHADLLINVGVAGCVSPELGVLDVALSSEVAFHDENSKYFEDCYPFKTIFPADEKLLKLCEEAIESMTDREFSYKVGRIATGDMFVEDKAVKSDIVCRLSPLCVEMEGAAIGQVAAMSGKPFLVVRSMSDNADGGAAQSIETMLSSAARHSASILLGMLRIAEEKA